MKKVLLLVLVLSFGKIYSQNFQLHYDFGEGRKHFTSTLEMFKPDEYGSTFFFVDLDYNVPGNNSISLAYFEIARYVTVYEKLAVTAQYNDGIGTAGSFAFPLNQSWLGGVSYPIDLGFVTLNTDILAKKIYNSEGIDGQLTVAWFVPFLDGKLNFSGFLDVWSQDKSLRNFNNTTDDKEFVLLTEPQLWYNVTSHLAVGGEFEISNNFLPGQSVVKGRPTLAAKWNF